MPTFCKKKGHGWTKKDSSFNRYNRDTFKASFRRWMKIRKVSIRCNSRMDLWQWGLTNWTISCAKAAIYQIRIISNRGNKEGKKIIIILRKNQSGSMIWAHYPILSKKRRKFTCCNKIWCLKENTIGIWVRNWTTKWNCWRCKTRLYWRMKTK